MRVLCKFMMLGIVLTAMLVMARTTVTEFTGTETPSWPPSEFTFKCPQGQPTGGFPFSPPCTEGAVHARGLVFQYLEAATDDRMSGTSTVSVNANWDGWTALGPGSGPMWGTIQLSVSGGGVWEGTWTGNRTVKANGGYSTIRVVMFGTQGSVNGLKAEWVIVYTPASPVGNFSGEIINPGGK